MRDFYQKLVESVVYPLDARRRGSRELKLLAELERSQWLSPDRLHDLRFQSLRRLIEHAARYVPFYQRRFAEAGFDPRTVKDFDDLKKLPFLTKKDIQENVAELISTFYPRTDLVRNYTGGSTCTPMVFYHSKERVDSRQAATLRHNRWAGYRVGCKTAIIWGHPRDIGLWGLARSKSFFASAKSRLRNSLIDRQLLCDSSAFTEASLSRFAQDFRRFRPEIILAYANSLAAVVDYCAANGIDLPKPRGIITSAELLTPENRVKIENYFHLKIFDRYGARETSIVASECEMHDGLHICAENLHLEFIENGMAVKPGEIGEIVVTDFGSLAFPFMRYQIGDMGALATGSCGCGRSLPRMQMIAGRTTDFLCAPDGRRVSGVALTGYLVALIPGVRQGQIVQRERNKLTFNLVVDERFNESSLSMIREKVAYFFGEAMQVDYNYVSSIPTEASGKYRFSICDLPPLEESK